MLILQHFKALRKETRHICVCCVITLTLNMYNKHASTHGCNTLPYNSPYVCLNVAFLYVECLEVHVHACALCVFVRECVCSWYNWVSN